MRTFEIDDPQGRVPRFEMQVPDEWSSGEIQAAIDQELIRRSPKTDPTANMSGLSKFTAGVGRGMVNVGRQLGNIAGIIPDETLKQYAELDKALLNTTPGAIGNIAGELVSTAPIGGAVASTLAKGVPLAMRGGNVMRGAARGLTEGATEGAILAGPDNRLSGAGVGAAIGAPVGALGTIATRGFAQPTAESQKLMDMGIDLTPGQMRPQGMWNAIEESMGSVPFIGPGVDRAREGAKEQFTEAMIQKTRPPGAPVATGNNLSDKLDDVYGQFNQSYTPFKRYKAPSTAGSELLSMFQSVATNPDNFIGDNELRTVYKYLKNQTSKIRDKSKVTTGDILKIRSNIRRQLTAQKKKANRDEGTIDILSKTEGNITNYLDSILPDELSGRLRDIDRQYGLYMIAQDAIGRAKDKGAPTPNQWSEAVKKAESSKSAYARGGGRFRDEVQAANEAFETVAPRTGARAVTLGMLGLGASGAANIGLGDPITPFLAPMGLGALALSRTGREASLGVTGLQQQLQNRLATPAGQAFVSPVLRGLLPVSAMQGQQEQ